MSEGLGHAECLSWFRALGFSSILSPVTVHSCGCVMLLRHPVSFKRKWVDSDGRFLLCEFSYFDCMHLIAIRPGTLSLKVCLL